MGRTGGRVGKVGKGGGGRYVHVDSFIEECMRGAGSVREVCAWRVFVHMVWWNGEARCVGGVIVEGGTE